MAMHWIAFALLSSGAVGLKPAAMKRRTVYQIVTDRFALERDHPDTCDSSKRDCPLGGYCGGTWKAITDKIPYIAGMGFDALWISPITSVVDCAYHGYWPQRIFEVNSHFGSHADLLTLSKKAHEAGMALILDSVVNHIGPFNSTIENLTEFYPFDKPEHFHFNPYVPYHCDGMKDDISQHEREVCWLNTYLPDLKQENPVVTEALLKFVKHTTEVFGFDALRIDAAPYVNKSFYRQMKKQVAADLYTVGEVAIGKQPLEYLASYQRTTEEMRTTETTGWSTEDNVYGPLLDGVMNYPLFGHLRSAFQITTGEKGHPEWSLEKFAEQWTELKNLFYSIGANFNFVDNHDQDRWLLSSPDWDTYRRAMVASFFLPGIPVAYYGDELGVKGDIGMEGRRTPLWREGKYNYYHPLYRWTARLVAARKAMLGSLSDDEIDDLSNFTVNDFSLSFQRGYSVVVLSQRLPLSIDEVVTEIPTSHPEGTTLCDSLKEPFLTSPLERCGVVAKGGLISFKMDGEPMVLQPPSTETAFDTILSMCMVALPFWLFPVIMTLYFIYRQEHILSVCELPEPSEVNDPAGWAANSKVAVGDNGSSQKERKLPGKVVVASLEHIVANGKTVLVKSVAGGLGKVAGLLSDAHPGDFISIHPCIADQDYSFAEPDRSFSVTVGGEAQICKTFRYDRPDSEDPEAPQVTFYFIDHDMFRDREDGIYPSPMTKQTALAFYSLWNQAVAHMIDILQPDMYQIPDYHTAMAIMYLQKPVPITLVLHNAEYQGSIVTQPLSIKEARWLGDIFNLSEQRIAEETFYEGGFNMLMPALKHISTYQAGEGVCAVSRNYAMECHWLHAVFWCLPELRGIDNFMPEGERPEIEDDDAIFRQKKREAKIHFQKEYGLKVDPNARIFVFVGRWVKAKGMDIIADVAEWLLETYKDAQLVMVGPPGDAYGSYTQMKLEAMANSGRFKNRHFICAHFLRVPIELKLGCDFCLMPSRDEPFGYVDIEFAWFGAVTLGSFRGGLGKVPGFYYIFSPFHSQTQAQHALQRTIDAAMTCPDEQLSKMSTIARRCAFPKATWQEEMKDFYSAAMVNFTPPTRSSGSGCLAPAADMGMAEQREELRTPLLADLNNFKGGTISRKGLGGLPTVTSGTVLCAPEDSEEAPASLEALRNQTNDDFRRLASPQSDDDNMSVASSVVELEMGAEATPPSRRQRKNSKDSSASFMRSKSPQQDDDNCSVISSVDMEQGGSSVGDMPEEYLNKEENEFLRQEVSENKVMELIRATSTQNSLTNRPMLGCNTMLSKSIWELELARESDPLTLLLGRSILGTNFIDLMIASAYITGPLYGAFVIGVGGTDDHSATLGFLQALGLVNCLSIIVWTTATLYVPPNRLMFFSMLLRCLLVLVRIAGLPQSVANVALGFVSSSDVTLIYFGFMGQQARDMSKLAIRTSLLITLRQCIAEFLYTPLSLASESADIQVMLAMSAVWAVYAFCLLKAPTAYQGFCLPNFWPQFHGIKRMRVPCLLMFAQVIRGFSYAPIVVTTLRCAQINFNGDVLSTDIFLFLVSSCFGLGIIVASFSLHPDGSILLVKAFTCLSAQSFPLKVWAMSKYNPSTQPMWFLDMLIAVSNVFDIFGLTVSGITIVLTVRSRWRFVVFCCTFSALTNLTQSASFTLLRDVWGATSPLLERYSDQVVYAATVPCIIDFIIRIYAVKFFDLEVHHSLWTAQQFRVAAFHNKRK